MIRVVNISSDYNCLPTELVLPNQNVNFLSTHYNIIPVDFYGGVIIITVEPCCYLSYYTCRVCVYDAFSYDKKKKKKIIARYYSLLYQWPSYTVIARITPVNQDVVYKKKKKI